MDLQILDRIVALVGFGITIWQLWTTKAAANAAREAANNAFAAIRKLEATTKMHDISSRSRELLRLLRSKNISSAAPAAFELRDTVARFRHDDQSKRVVDEATWKQVVADVRGVHERLESLAMTTKSSAADREALMHEVSRLHTLFTEFAARAAINGVDDANTN